MNTAIAEYFRTVWSELSCPKAFFIAVAVLLMANLSALIDVVAHPEIPYFDEEHLIVGGITAFSTAVLFAILVVYLTSLRMSERRLRSLFEISPDFIYILDTRGVILHVNPAVIGKSGYQKNELIGRGINEFLKQSSQKIFNEHFPLLMKQGSCRVEVEVMSRDGGASIMDCSAVAMRDRKGNVTSLVVSQRDITDRKNWEAERERLIAQLQDALEKVKTLRGFIPICASCKKVRDDQGYWKQVEIYVSEHSLAEFSHSVCPECMKKLYPDYS